MVVRWPSLAQGMRQSCPWLAGTADEEGRTGHETEHRVLCLVSEPSICLCHVMRG